MVRRNVGRINAHCLNRMDRLQRFLDLRPAAETEQAFTAGAHVGQCCVALARANPCKMSICENDGAVIIGGSAHEREDATRRERYQAPLMVEHLLLGYPAETDPVLDARLDPH